MKNRLFSGIVVAVFTLAILALPAMGRAQQQSSAQEDDGVFWIGSIFLSIVHVPYKALTCAATQASAATFYTATFGVAGHYDGGTNGKDIGETARRSCTGAWIITPKQVKEDYGS